MDCFTTLRWTARNLEMYVAGIEMCWNAFWNPLQQSGVHFILEEEGLVSSFPTCLLRGYTVDTYGMCLAGLLLTSAHFVLAVTPKYFATMFLGGYNAGTPFALYVV